LIYYILKLFFIYTLENKDYRTTRSVNFTIIVFLNFDEYSNNKKYLGIYHKINNELFRLIRVYLSGK